MIAPADAFERRDRRLLALLEGGEGRLEGEDGSILRVAGRDGLKRARLDPARLDAWRDAGWVRIDGASPRRIRLTDLGRARLRRAETLGEIDGFRLQHGEVRPSGAAGAVGAATDHAESPLAWLARRRDRDGRAYLSPARLAAGERLRADYTLAKMMPTVTSNWSIGRIQGGAAGVAGLADLTDRAVAARGRVEAALAAVGLDLAGVLVDVCCFLKGLETVESERRWPARSAKVVLDIALGRLADHYGLAEEARGPDRTGRLRAWGTPDHRPSERRSPPA
ncbi:MAG: DUF6456 domain-containing protein [Hyphomicrobiales bacterium]|nr:DUF6456 domain-containing protein [Hyphomicrobiales bacterium]